MNRRPVRGAGNRLAPLLLLLGACASSPEVTYYTLATASGDTVTNDVAGAVPSTTTASQPVIGVGPFAFPEYLRRQQMVTREQGALMRVDDYHRWVESLDLNAGRALAAELDARLPGAVAIPIPGTNFPIDYQLSGSVFRFEADPRGHVELVLQWELRRIDPEHSVVAPMTSRYRSAATPSDPQSVAAAMADTLSRFARDVAAAFQGQSSE